MPEFSADSIYAQHWKTVQPFQFDEAVAQVFPDMIQRSVPGYSLTLPLIGLLAGRYAQPRTNCYDLGASLGAATLMMRHQITQPDCRIVAIDNAPAMVARCREVIAADNAVLPVEVVQADILDYPLIQASVVVLNFTFQFIPAARREELLDRILHALVPGGALILSEKIQFADAAQNERFIAIHHDYKRANGYTDLEISQKRTALENVLIPETVETHRTRILQAGFQSCELWFQALNFVSLLALKE